LRDTVEHRVGIVAGPDPEKFKREQHGTTDIRPAIKDADDERDCASVGG
jgi:hypothetical protein